MAAVRVALSNDYELALAGIAALLAQHPDRVELVLLTTASDLPTVDVILYDTFGRLPRDDEKLRRLIRANAAPVIVYSWESYPVVAARAAGAAGYLHKGLGSDELVDAIIDVHDGRLFESRDPDPDGDTAPTWPGREHGLSVKEAEVIGWLARGLSNREIATGAYLGVDTVKARLKSAYRKIGVTGRAGAVAWALRHGFDDGPPPAAPAGEVG